MYHPNRSTDVAQNSFSVFWHIEILVQWTKSILSLVLFLDMASPILGEFIDISENSSACIINMDAGTYFTASNIRVNILIKETAWSSEMSAYLYCNTRRHISEWDNL